MRRTESRSGQPSVREPSPPFGHVSWHEGVAQQAVAHDAAEDMVLLAETVMGREGGLPRPQGLPAYLAKIARYPLWAISVRALVGAAVLPVPMFLYGGTRYHYLVTVDGQYHFDQNALLSGAVLALVGWLVGMLVGALWGLLVVRYARSRVRPVGTSRPLTIVGVADEQRDRRLGVAHGSRRGDRERLDGVPVRGRA